MTSSNISFPALSRPLTDYFAIAKLLATSPGTAPTPLCSFSVGLTASHLTLKPSVWCMSVQEAADMFQLPDLPAALSCFVAFEKDCGPSVLSPVGGHRRTAGTVLLFDELQVSYTRVQFPQKGSVTSSPDAVLCPPINILALWPIWHCPCSYHPKFHVARHQSSWYVSITFSVLHDCNLLAPRHTIIQLWLLMRPIPKKVAMTNCMTAF